MDKLGEPEAPVKDRAGDRWGCHSEKARIEFGCHEDQALTRPLGLIGVSAFPGVLKNPSESFTF